MQNRPAELFVETLYRGLVWGHIKSELSVLFIGFLKFIVFFHCYEQAQK